MLKPKDNIETQKNNIETTKEPTFLSLNIGNILGIGTHEKQRQKLINQIESDKKMCPAKKTLLLNNLQHQSTKTLKNLQIIQAKGFPFDIHQKQLWNPQIASEYINSFFTLDDATGTSCIVDFADSKFGGGVLGPNGFAQEEKLLMETNLLLEAGKYNRLETQPLYIQALQTGEFHEKGVKLYGNSRYGTKGNNTIDKANINSQNISNYYQQIDPPKEINVVAMAAINFSKESTKEYNKHNLEQMFLTAVYGFQKHTENGGKIIHSGAWGAGIFQNSENVTCILQILAAQAAGLELKYHGSEEAYNSALRFLKGEHIKGKSYREVFQNIAGYMQKRHKNKHFWQPRK